MFVGEGNKRGEARGARTLEERVGAREDTGKTLGKKGHRVMASSMCRI